MEVEKIGTCIFDSARAALDMEATLGDRIRYCEAVVTNTQYNEPMRHAFVLIDNFMVYDGAAKELVLKEQYYKTGEVRKVHEMTCDELRRNIDKTQSYTWWYLTDEDGY